MQIVNFDQNTFERLFNQHHPSPECRGRALNKESKYQNLLEDTETTTDEFILLGHFLQDNRIIESSGSPETIGRTFHQSGGDYLKTERFLFVCYNRMDIDITRDRLAVLLL